MAGTGTDYRGDEELALLLLHAGIPKSVAEIRDLIAGVNAAPSGADPDGWMALVAPGIDGPLAEQLRALRVAMTPPQSLPDHLARLTALREKLRQLGLDGFVIPRSDEHQGEYVPKRAERLAWVTGFTGSAGVAVVTLDRAAIFVDGRYTLQVRAEVPGEFFEHYHLIEQPHMPWAARAIPPGGRLGYDPWLHTTHWVERMRDECARAQRDLVACPVNPIDAVWPDQPPAPLSPVVPHDLRYAGRSSAEKRQQIAALLTEAGDAAAVITQPDSIAWLLNIRGGDVPHTPLPLSFALIRSDGTVDLFMDDRKAVSDLPVHLGNQVAIRPPESLAQTLDDLGATGARVRVDPATGASWISDRLSGAGAEVHRADDPCLLPKAIKHPVELSGTRAAHLRDGIAVTRFLHWLSREAGTGSVTEIDAARRLLELRREGDLFRDLSFETISGAGPNGAIVHYRVSGKTNLRLEAGTLYLVDSGAQYLDGTTDITRTVAIGTPTDEMRDRFTRVLKGHIAIATVRFPHGTSGAQIDALARVALWAGGFDYDHGTGHGVGSYLSVHEGPQRISKAGPGVKLEPGMILSNEPGYYKNGAYGIRIENLVAVTPCAEIPDAERPMLSFETLTLAPIDRALIDATLLTPAETGWLNSYHQRVRSSLAPHLDAATATWLEAATAPIGA